MRTQVDITVSNILGHRSRKCYVVLANMSTQARDARSLLLVCSSSGGGC